MPLSINPVVGIFGLLLACLVQLHPQSAKAECLTDSDGNGILTSSATDVGKDRVRLALDPDTETVEGAKVTLGQIEKLLEKQTELPVKVKNTKETVEIYSKAGVMEIRKLLANLESDCENADPWLEIAAMDFGKSSSGMSANLRAKKKRTNATLDTDLDANADRFEAEVLDVFHGPFPEVFLYLKITDSGKQKRRPGRRLMAMPHYNLLRSGQPKLTSTETVTNLQAYFLKPGDRIAASIKEKTTRKGRRWWVLNPIQRLPPLKVEEPKPPAFALIDRARAQDKISNEKAIEYKVYSLFAGHKLPPAYRSNTPNRGATLFLKRVRHEWKSYSPKLKDRIRPHLKSLRLEDKR